MSRVLVLVAALSLVGCTFGDLSCGSIKNQLFTEKKKCLTDFIQIKLHNDTDAGSEKTCTSMQDIEDKFLLTYNNLSTCYNNSDKFNHSKIIYSAMNTRLVFVKAALDDNKVNEFFKNDGLQCIRKNGPDIVQNCLLNILPNVTNVKSIRYSLIRMGPLMFSYDTRRACSQQSSIANCTVDRLKSCHNATIDLILSLHGAMKGYCNHTSTVNIQAHRKLSVSTIIIGTLVALIILLVLALFLVQKMRKHSKRQSRSYSIGYEAKER